MEFYLLELFVGKLALLRQDLDRNSDLSYIVEQSGKVYSVAFILALSCKSRYPE